MGYRANDGVAGLTIDAVTNSLKLLERFIWLSCGAGRARTDDDGIMSSGL